MYRSWKHKYGNTKPVEHDMQEYDRQLPNRNHQMLPVPQQHQHGMIKLGDWTSPSVIDNLIQVYCFK